MRILILNWYDLNNPLAGGAERYLFEIFGRLALQGHQISLLAQDYPGAEKSDVIKGIQVIRIPAQGKDLVKKAGKTIFSSFMYYLQNWQKYDIVIDCVNKVPYFTPCYVWNKRIALQHHFNGATFQIERPKDGWVFQKIEQFYFNLFYRAEQFVVVSPSTRDELPNYGISPDNCVVIYNAVNCPDIPHQPSEYPSIVYLGRLQKYKSVDVLLNAMPEVLAKIPSAHLIIVGSGEDKDKLMGLTEQLGIEKSIEFTGFVEEKRKFEILSEAWVHVNPSKKEGWGISVFEAAGYRVPTVCSRVEGLKDAVKDQITGCLFQYGDHKELANQLIDLLAHNEKRLALGENAFDYSQRFSWGNSMIEMERFLEMVVSEQNQIIPENILQSVAFPNPL
jgi:glycosyltransferase involved in cell wall biosynthesis